MSSVNKVILVGYLKEVPELQTFKGNIGYLHFELGTKETITKGDHQIEHTEWHRVIMRYQFAEKVVRTLKPDMLIHIQGRLRTRTIFNNAVKHYVVEIVGNLLEVLE